MLSAYISKKEVIIVSRKFVFDIETTPRPGIMDTWYPQWASEKYPGKEGQDLEDMAALHAEFGMVCAIAIGNALTDDPPTVYTAGSVEEEKELIKSVMDIFDSDSAILVGHNIKGFDIPFMAKRFMAQWGFVPRALNFGGKKPWEIPHIDTMELMRFGGGASMSLRSACLMLDIDDPKGSVCGSEVPQLFREGKTDIIGQYCSGDFVAERILYRKLREALA